MAIYNREDPRTALPQLEKQFNARFDGLLDMFYPVGCFFETSDVEFDPNKSWGGEWELETEGLVHIGAGENYEAGDTGGSKYMQAHTHGFTQPKIPNHTHTGYYRKDNTIGGGADRLGHSGAYSASNITITPSSGGGGSCTGGAVGAVSGATTGNADNMQPYIVVNRWHRVN